jgi:hypothetical protein
MAPSAHSQRRFHHAVFYAASAVLLASASLLTLGGCDSASGQADKDVKAQLDSAQAADAAAKTPPTASDAGLDKAARETTDSLPMQVHAKILFANSELRLAENTAAQVTVNDQLIDRLAREIGLIGGQIQANNAAVAALEKYDPSKPGAGGKSILDSVKDTQSMVTGSDDKPDWMKTDAASLASLSAADKKAADLQTKVVGLNEKLKAETDQRNELLDQADKLTMQSQHEHGDKSVDLYVQGSDARKKAADLTVTIDADTAELARNTADLALQQGQHDALTATIAGLDKKSKDVSDEWTAVQRQIAALNTASKELLGDDPVTPPAPDKKTGDLTTKATIGDKAAAIADLAKANVKLRSTAETHFNKAIELYGQAKGLATKAVADLNAEKLKFDQAKVERVAWDSAIAALDPNTDDFLQADALLQKANFNARSAEEAKVRLDMITAIKPILAGAKLTPLPTLDESNPDLSKQEKDAVGTAESGAVGAFTKAGGLLDHVSTSTSPMELRAAAKADEIFDQLGWSVLEATAGDAQESAKHMELARAQVAAAATENISLPPLPVELTGSASAMESGGPPVQTPPGSGAGVGNKSK